MKDGEKRILTVQTARIAVYGAGAMGTVLGAFLTLGGLQVDLITRNREHVAGLQKEGARVECQADGKTVCTPVRASLPENMGEYDVIFLMTKQRHNAEIVQTLLPHLKKEGILCTTQNGLPEPLIAEIAGNERTYGAVVSFGANLIGGGKVALTSKMEAMSIQIGGYENGEEKLPLLEEILAHAGKISDNPQFVQKTELLGARWSKLAVNAAFSGLSVVTGCTFGEVAKRRKSRKIALGVLRECMDVARALGVKLQPTQGHDMEKLLGGKTPLKRFISYMVLPFAMKKHKKLHSGMLLDLQRGKKCEIDFVNGVVVREGEKVGVETPLCRQIVELVHGIEKGLYEIDYKNVDFFSL